MSLVEHAKREFEALGWPGDCDMQAMVCDNVIELIEAFSKQGHSGSSAPYVLNIFEQLARFNPIAPLTGEDNEWTDVAKENGEPLYQNNRDSEVFKNNEGAYWISGKIFRDKDGCTYTSRDSRVSVTFPWKKPKPEIIDVDS
jgi:hypothetical protein